MTSKEEDKLLVWSVALHKVDHTRNSHTYKLDLVWYTLVMPAFEGGDFKVNLGYMIHAWQI